ncbi:hypothetical protein K431DRAFT_269172 [Polychaeton citri CBS 116435]|uniref:Mitochondrial carrier n=1 Tax=Polychaeton citri CBS 116435 TaxID=1314669 RepID=A0A9P4UMB6_9PEZI|nr:hypothetical protein K431DRAFT_269172 [Polychaeton citri CBS 116435]
MDAASSPDHFPLQSSRQPNPLRPYYIPPSIGPVPGASPSQPSQTRPAPSSSNYGSGARDYLPDIDIDVGGVGGDAWASVRQMMDALAWRYFSILLAQPFEVGKTALQVSLPPSAIPTIEIQSKRRKKTRKDDDRSPGGRKDGSDYDAYGSSDEATEEEGYDSERSEGMPDYFSSSTPQSRSRSPRKRRRSPIASSRTSKDPSPRNSRTKRSREVAQAEYKLQLRRADSITHAMGEVYRTSGALGLWRASNATFLYTIITRTTDSFIRSILLATLGLPELDSPANSSIPSGVNLIEGLDLSDSPSPVVTLLVIGASSCLTGLLLSPLDLVRTRLILTPTHHQPRGVLQSLKRLPSLLIPSDLALPTALFHTIPSLFSASVSMVLRSNRLTPESSPNAWSLATFSASLVELFIRLPLETVLRRAQMSSIAATRRQEQLEDVPTIVYPAPYPGVWRTIYGIMYLEGETTIKDSKGMLRTKRGQGASGLIRGWRVGFWGLVGVWGAGALGTSSEGRRGEF